MIRAAGQKIVLTDTAYSKSAHFLYQTVAHQLVHIILFHFFLVRCLFLGNYSFLKILHLRTFQISQTSRGICKVSIQPVTNQSVYYWIRYLSNYVCYRLFIEFCENFYRKVQDLIMIITNFIHLFVAVLSASSFPSVFGAIFQAVGCAGSKQWMMVHMDSDPKVIFARP